MSWHFKMAPIKSLLADTSAKMAQSHIDLEVAGSAACCLSTGTTRVLPGEPGGGASSESVGGQ